MQLAILDWRDDLDAPIKVARHPVR